MTMTSQTPSVLMIGGAFSVEGGRTSGYFKKLATAITALWPTASVDILNGGTYEVLCAQVAQVREVSHLFWFADVPNELPKLLPVLRQKNPSVVLISSKNNRAQRYDRAALFARIKAAQGNVLVEFGDGDSGQLVASILTANETVILEKSEDISEVARCLVALFDNKGIQA